MLRSILQLKVMLRVACLTSIWYKRFFGINCRVPAKWGLNNYVRAKSMETAELKSAISELSARVDKIRDWL
jgi:hypothetical protein